MKLEENKASTFRWRTWLLLVLVAIAAAYYYVNNVTPDENKKPDATNNEEGQRGADGKSDKKGKGVSSVTAEPVTLADVPVYLNGLGSVTGLHTVTVRSRIDGELLHVHYKEGAIVKEGELLAEIDPRTAQIQLMQAEGQLLRDEALLKNAQLDADRYKILLAQDSIAAQQVATQESLVKQYQGTVTTDKALVANAKLQLSYTKITAPISGRLGLRLVDQGNMIKASDTTGLAVITQVQPISVVFTLPEDAVPAVMQQNTQGKTLTVEAFDRGGKNKLATGQLLAIDNQIDTNTGTVKLKSQFANTDNALFVNQFVNVRMLMNTLHSIPTIPSSAVQTGEKGTFVYVLKDDQTVTVRPVKLGTVDGEKVAVLDGLKAQELVVIDGTDKLREGAKAKRVTNNPSDAPPAPEAPTEHKNSKWKRDK